MATALDQSSSRPSQRLRIRRPGVSDGGSTRPLEVFGTRGGYSADPNSPLPRVQLVEGVHYTASMLSTMISARAADRLVGELATFARIHEVVPFIVIELEAGQGGTTLALLDEKAVYRTIAYSDLAPQIQASSQLFKLVKMRGDGLPNLQVQGGAFKGLNPNLNPHEWPIIFLLHSWRDLNVLEQQYGDIAALFAIEGKAEQLPTWAKEARTIPIRGVEARVETSLTLISSPRYVGNRSASLLSLERGTVPVPPYTGKIPDAKSEEWNAELPKFIHHLISHLVDSRTADRVTASEDAMQVWARALTHSTYNPSSNYEMLELLGDRFLEVSFTRYLLDIFPSIDEKGITNIKSAYMRRGFQAGLTVRMGIAPWIRTSLLHIDASVLEDVFESIIGALADVMDRMVLRGSSYLSTLTLVDRIFQGVEIDPSTGLGAAKSQVFEIFKILGLQSTRDMQHFREVWVEDSPEDRIQLLQIHLFPGEQTFPDRARERLGLSGSSNIITIGTGHASSKDDAAERAYTQALAWFRDRKVTPSRLRWERQQAQIQTAIRRNPSIETALKSKMQKNNLARIYFEVPTVPGEPTGSILYLMGIEDGQSAPVSLAIVRGDPRNINDLQDQALTSWLGA